jgi:uncharacterized protein (TIGR04255 family)
LFGCRFGIMINVTEAKKYRHAPVALTVMEIKHPQSNYLSRGDLAGMKQKLEHVAPLQKAEDVAEVQMIVNPGAPPQTNSKNVTLHRFSVRDKRTSITYSNESIVIETTEYLNWTWFRRFVEEAVSVRQEIAPVDGIERIGLRYIDEIRVPKEGESVDWHNWVDPSLLPPAYPGLHPLQQQAVVQYKTGVPEDTLTLRYGAVNGQPAVVVGPNLVRANAPGPGPYFLLDTDSAWTLAPGSPVPELSLGFVTETANRLHAPAEGLFEALITDRSRTEVFEGE